MGRRIAVAIALGACGRFGFDDRPRDGDGAAGDTNGDAVVCHPVADDVMVAAIGNDQPPFPRPQSYTAANGIVLDNNSKLEWQQTFDTTVHTWQDANTHCAQLALAGGCWRLPQRIELVSIANYALNTGASSAIDQSAFPLTPAAGFWTATPLVGTATMAWTVTFADGSTGTNAMTSGLLVRCVRSTVAPPMTRYDVGATSVLDHATGLRWQRMIDAGIYNFNAATTFCAGLNLEGLMWRVPSIQELETLVDTSASNVAIDPTAFPNTPTGLHWSGTLRSTDSQSGWTVDFGVGVASRPISSMAPVRCVH